MHRAFAHAVAVLTFLAVASGGAEETARLEIRALANEGVLLRAGETTIAIDAVIVRPLAEYGALPADAWAAMLAGAPPFEDLDLLLVSHPHEDHVDAGATAELLRAWPGLRLISSPPVIEAVRRALGDAAAAERLEVVAPGPGESIERTVGEATIRFLRLRHGGRTYDEIWNLGHVVDLGGARTLHVGDAEGVPRTFESYDLPALGIDVALLPYWIFEDEIAPGLLDAPTVVALHVPPAELASVRADLERRRAGIVVPSPLAPLR